MHERGPFLVPLSFPVAWNQPPLVSFSAIIAISILKAKPISPPSHCTSEYGIHLCGAKIGKHALRVPFPCICIGLVLLPSYEISSQTARCIDSLLHRFSYTHTHTICANTHKKSTSTI